MTDNRYSIVVIFDCTNGNPNGDPARGSDVRINPYTGCGVVTNQCTKRHIRDTIYTLFGDELYIKPNTNLSKAQDAFTKATFGKTMKACGKTPEDKAAVVHALCEKFIDVRLFGAVVTQIAQKIQGPVQVTDATSIDPVRPMTMSITCCAGAGDGDDDKDRTKNMGSRSLIPYGLYEFHIDITPTACRNIDYTEEDLQKLFCAIEHMYDLHKTATSGEQVLRKFVIFKHSLKYGDQPCHQLYDAVKVKKLCEGMPLSFADYEISIDRDAVDDTIEIIERV